MVCLSRRLERKRRSPSLSLRQPANPVGIWRGNWGTAQGTSGDPMKPAVGPGERECMQHPQVGPWLLDSAKPMPGLLSRCCLGQEPYLCLADAHRPRQRSKGSKSRQHRSSSVSENRVTQHMSTEPCFPRQITVMLAGVSLSSQTCETQANT